MKHFDYVNTPRTFLTPYTVAMLTGIHEHKGKQVLFIEAFADVLSSLMEMAKIQSIGASNRIEGIHTTDKRLEELVKNKTSPRNRDEQEIAGYRDVLATIHESFNYINPTPNIILQLHKQLYSHSKISIGGSYKNNDNYVIETDANGNEKIRFKPTPAHQTSDAMERLCDAFKKAIEKNEHDPLILIPMFILDFLCIHPFNDGNGRVSRLLTLLLLYRAGFIVGKYISIEKLIENSKYTYYEVLQDSSINWHENENDYAPFINYYLGLLIRAYKEFEERVERFSDKNLSKPIRIKSFIDDKLGKFSKKEIIEACPEISKVTVERTLTALVKEGYIKKIGAGRSTVYAKN
ncbi:MAG: Fic family protein [Oscillospiraceae bacterium]|jgi:Fic family protein|nr:Fic family protein [Oscillospiraceae bacterium]